MKNGKNLFSICCAFLFSFTILSADISVDLPSVEVNVTESFRIPISIGVLENPDIYSVYSAISFNSAIIELSDVTTDSCITEDWNAPLFSETDGNLNIGIFGTQALSSGGILCNLHFDVITVIDTFSTLVFDEFIFNEGNPAAALSNGFILIIDRVPEITPVADISASEGDLIEFDISALDPFDSELTLSAFDLPDSSIFSDLGDGNGFFQWQTTQLSAGVYEAGFSATNEELFSDTIYVNITVENVLNVLLPEIETASSDSIMIPVYTDEVSALGIFSYYAKILYDPAVLDPDELLTSGTISDGWGTLDYNLNVPGEIFVSNFGTEELSGNGILFNIDFDIIGANGSSSDLTFDFFVFNDGIPDANLIDGMIFIGTPVAEFSSNITQGYSPLNIDFYDLSTAGPVTITEWFWDFDDGNNSNLQNPSHTFYESGSYTISLTVTNENDSTDTEIKINYITVLPIDADFSANSTNGFYPAFDVDFTDHSLGNITSWNWDFQNDGTTDSYEQNPAFTYTQVGTFSVKLDVSDGTNVDSLILENYITVEYAPPAAPADIWIRIDEYNADIAWTAVDTTIYGAPIDVDFYILYGSENPYSGYIILNTTQGTSYTQHYITLFNDKMFYYVEAFVGTRQELDNYIEKLELNTENTK